MEQSIKRGGHEKIIIHELAFGGQIQTDVDYVFRGIGDEHPEFGKRDLRVRIRCVSLQCSIPLFYLSISAVFEVKERPGKKEEC